MRVEWLGHACFLVTSDNGTTIITDPYEPGYRGLINYDEINQEADIVTVSHDHGDHNAVSSVLGQPQVVRDGAPGNVKGIPFEVVPCYHDQVEGRERGRNAIICFTVDGIRVAHLGDLGHMLDEEQVAKLGQVDLLLAPVGGPAATIEIDQLWELCRQIKPRIVIPMHFRNERCPFPKYEVADFIKGKPNVETHDDAQLELRQNALPSTTKVVVLRHTR